jgi:hypothetical protein
MAGMKPFFLTGANAKIKVNNRTLAYCTNLSYSIEVKHQAPTVLGMYEPTSVEPLGYMVTGSFSVVRYIADVKGKTGKSPDGTSETGNGIGYMGPDGNSVSKLLAGFDLKNGADGRTYDNLNPRQLEKATGFEIEVFQKVEGDQVSVAKIRGARITRAHFNIAVNQPANQTFNFTALYADEDSFIADFSGIGQQFS